MQTAATNRQSNVPTSVTGREDGANAEPATREEDQASFRLLLSWGQRCAGPAWEGAGEVLINFM